MPNKQLNDVFLSMPVLELTQWWQQLDSETRRLSEQLGLSDYPLEIASDHQSIDVSGEFSQWLAIHKMANLGQFLEPLVSSPFTMTQALSVRKKLKTAEQHLGYVLRNGKDDALPLITDKNSLLIAVMYYRHLYRYQDVSSNISIMRSGIDAEKERVRENAELLAIKIKQYCNMHPKQAQGAKRIFGYCFDGEQAPLGSHLFDKVSLTAQLTNNFKDAITNTFVSPMLDASVDGKTLKSDAMLENLETLNRKITRIRDKLKALYFLNIFLELRDEINQQKIENVNYLSELTANDYISYIEKCLSCHLTGSALTKALSIWERASQLAKHNEPSKQSVSNALYAVGSSALSLIGYLPKKITPTPIQNVTGQVVNAIMDKTYITAGIKSAGYKLGISSKAQSERISNQMIHEVSRMKREISSSLHDEIGLNTEDLNAASSHQILTLIHTSTKLKKEISALKQALHSYQLDFGGRGIIAFSTAWWFGKITNFMLKRPFLSRLLHDNLRYLNVVSELQDKLSALQEALDKEDLSNRECEQLEREYLDVKRLTAIKAIDIKCSSLYGLLFKQSREDAFNRLHSAMHISSTEEDPFVIATASPVA